MPPLCCLRFLLFGCVSLFSRWHAFSTACTKAIDYSKISSGWVIRRMTLMGRRLRQPPARYAVAQVNDGRKVGGHLNIHDVSSGYAPRLTPNDNPRDNAEMPGQCIALVR